MHHLFAFYLCILLANGDERVTYTSKEGNYKLTHGRDWEKVPALNEFFQLTLKRGANVIMVPALEANSSMEELLEDIDAGLKVESQATKELGRKKLTVAGEPATTLYLSTMRGGIKGRLYATVFTHQGIAYRIMGVKAGRVRSSTFSPGQRA